MISLSIKGDLRPLQRAAVNLRAKQIPFAMSLALNNLAKGVAAEERAAIDDTFKTPTPFTENAYRIQVATKSRPVAIVAAKDIQAEYLAPYVVGGDRSYGNKKGMLVPITGNVGLNKYGNLSRGKLASLKAKPGVFIGSVHTRAGKTLSGVWQRTNTKRGPRGRGKGRPGTDAARSSLKLLIKFADTTPVTKRLPFEQRARAYLARNVARELDAAMRQALATARR